MFTEKCPQNLKKKKLLPHLASRFECTAITFQQSAVKSVYSYLHVRTVTVPY